VESDKQSYRESFKLSLLTTLPDPHYPAPNPHAIINPMENDIAKNKGILKGTSKN
jgi:hypothetical protein